MITLSATINLLEGQNSSLRATINNNAHRIASDISSVVGTKKSGANPFFLGKTKLGSGGVFKSKKVGYYIGDVFSDNSGYFKTPYRIVITSKGSNITNLTFVFDEQGNQHPIEMTVGGKTIRDDDNIWTITDLGGVDALSVEILNWNTPNAPLKITGIFAEVKIEINNRNLISLNSITNSRGDNDLPSWGIISNSGELVFNDVTGEVRDYIEGGLLREDTKITISLNDTLTRKSEIVGVFKTSDWNYDNNNRQISVTFKDELEEWQDINIPSIEYTPKKAEHIRALVFYELLRSVTTLNGYNIKSYKELEGKTYDKLSNTTISFPMLNSGSLWSAWRKLCEVCQLYIYQEKDGTINCIYGEN
jgi:hypothetical protein